MAAEVSAVTPDLVDLLEGGVSIFVGTSDAERRPEAIRAVGAVVAPDRKKLTVFVPVATAKRTVDNLAQRREIAVGFSRTLDHLSIQIKGRCDVRLATDAERSVCERYLGAYVEALYVIGLPRNLTRRMTVWPAYALEVEIRDVFAQTPGPGAGQRLEAKS